MAIINHTAGTWPMLGRLTQRKWPPEAGIFLVLVGISLFFEAIGWYLNGQSFIFNLERLQIIILQMAVIGIIAVGVNMVIITAGIDLSSGSVVAAAAVVSASLAQVSDFPRAVFPQLTDMPVIWPVLAGVAVGLVVGLINGSLIAYTAIPPFIATLGTMVAARGFAKWFTGAMPVSMLTDQFAWIGAGANPVVIFLVVAAIFHVVLRYTRFGRRVYAVGGNPEAARLAGLNVSGIICSVYVIMGLFVGLGAFVLAARLNSAEAVAGTGYELTVIASVVIGGTSLFGGSGSIFGTVIGTLLIGVLLNGLVLMNVSSYIQQIIIGIIIVLAVAFDTFAKSRRRKA